MQTNNLITTTLSERANLCRQYAQRTVKDETRRAPACVAGTPCNPCHAFWFAPQTGHGHWGTFPYNWGAFSYSSLRLLPSYVCSLRERDIIVHYSLFIVHYSLFFSTPLIPRQRGRLSLFHRLLSVAETSILNSQFSILN